MATAVSATGGAVPQTSGGSAVSAVKEVKTGVASSMASRTLVFLKPDTTEGNFCGKVLADFETAGLKIVAMKMMQLTQAQGEKFYEVHKERGFYKDLVKYVTRGPIVAVVLKASEDAFAKARGVIGATNPPQAAKDTIRGKYGVSLDANVIHGSDSAENAAKEISFFFAEHEIIG
jgi:nucleoside-diphosphate kinase